MLMVIPPRQPQQEVDVLAHSVQLLPQDLPVTLNTKAGKGEVGGVKGGYMV